MQLKFGERFASLSLTLTWNLLFHFKCTIISGNLVLKEHEAAKWLTKKQLNSVDWLPADKGLIEKLMNE